MYSLFLRKRGFKFLDGLLPGIKLSVLALCLLQHFTAGAQLTRHYANQVTQQSASNAANAADGDLSTQATLYTNPGYVFSIGSRADYVEVKFPSMVPAHTPTYVALSGVDGNRILDYILGGSLGGVLKGIVGALFTGNPNLDIVAKNGNNDVQSISIRPGGSTGSYGIEIGPDGFFYLKIIPNGNFDRIFIKLWTDFTAIGIFSGLNGNPSIGVRDVFYNTGVPFDCGEEFLTTSYDATGLNANILNLGGKPVTDPQFAIDDDPNSYSKIGYNSILNAQIATTISQSINFNRLSNPGEEAVMVFNQTASILSAAILQNITVKAYNGDTKVYESNLNLLLNGDLLGIISNIFGTTRPNRISIPVGARFDRIELSYYQLIGAGGVLTNPQLNLYGIYRVPVKPVLAHNSVLEACGGTNVILGVNAPVSDVTYTWFNSGLQPVYTGSSYSVVAPATGRSDTFFVASSRCAGKYSEYVPVVVKGNDALCSPSAINGTVDLSAYYSDSAIHAVLLNDSGKVVAAATVDSTTGNYKFGNTGKGSYRIVLVAGSVPPAVGSPVSGSNIGTDYGLNPGSRTVNVSGNGDPVTTDGFVITFIGPDLVTGLSTDRSSVSAGKNANITYAVSNKGKSGTTGLIYVVISVPTAGTLTLGSLPGGVSRLSSNQGRIVLQVTAPIGPNDILRIPAVYTAPSSVGLENLTAIIPEGYGGGERNSANNRSSIQLLLNQ